MAELGHDEGMPRREGTPRRYEETENPRNPPNSLLAKDTRRAAVWSYFVPVVVLFVVIGVAMVYWSNRPGTRNQDTEHERATATVGTTGSEQGGFDPATKPGSVKTEVERRGGSIATVTRVSDLSAGYAVPLEDGRRVELKDVKVTSAQGTTFWVEDGDAKAEVIATDGAAAVKPGARVNVTGHVEKDAKGAIRVRANRIEVGSR